MWLWYSSRECGTPSCCPLQEFATERALRVSRLPSEPEPGDPDSLHVMLRLPSGGRMERRFTGKDKLQVCLSVCLSDCHPFELCF